MSQNIRATGTSSPGMWMSSNVPGSGRAIMSASWIRLKPSMHDPSNSIPDSRASSSSAGVMANDLSIPCTSVNHSRTNRTLRSSTVLSTYSS